MRWAKGALCAGVLALVAAGCETIDAFSLSYLSSTPGRERVVAASVDNVAQSLEGVLKGQNLEAVVTRSGETVRIRSRTRDGKQFVAVLTRTSEGKTRVRIDWEGTGDDGMSYALLANLEYPFNP
jgi:hypothetical protein